MKSSQAHKEKSGRGAPAALVEMPGRFLDARSRFVKVAVGTRISPRPSIPRRSRRRVFSCPTAFSPLYCNDCFSGRAKRGDRYCEVVQCD
jgi:hypothetical protein